MESLDVDDGMNSHLNKQQTGRSAKILSMQRAPSLRAGHLNCRLVLAHLKEQFQTRQSPTSFANVR
jgi:hypothetical protein